LAILLLVVVVASARTSMKQEVSVSVLQPQYPWLYALQKSCAVFLERVEGLAAALALACQAGNLVNLDQLNTQEVQNLVGLDQTQEVEKEVEKEDVAMARQSSVVSGAKMKKWTPSQKMQA
jgi:hypothetical protein